MKTFLSCLFCWFCYSCTQTPNTIISNANIEATDSIDYSDYDKHEFFEDANIQPLDSLRALIQRSDQVLAFNTNGTSGNAADVYTYIANAYGHYVSPKRKLRALSDQEALELSDILCDSSIYEGSGSDCFIPHIAFVYYKKEQIIGQSNVCFLCAEVKSIPKSTKGLNDKGVKRLMGYCKNLGLKIVTPEELTY